MSQLQVTSKSCALGSAQGQGKAEAGPGMDTHLEVVISSPSVAEANCTTTDRLKTLKASGVTVKSHYGDKGKGWNRRHQQFFALQCCSWGGEKSKWLQPEETRVTSPTITPRVGEIMYFITACIMCSALHSVKGFNGTI